MENVVAALLQWISDHRDQAGYVVAGIACLESLAFVGIAIPGSALLLGVGGLVAAGSLPLWPIVFWAFVGAVLGDTISFILGQKLSHHIHNPRWDNAVQRSHEMILRYGSASVFVGRFIGPIRPIVPFIAGALGMPNHKFYIANISSALLWAPAWILPGFFAGEIIQQFAQIDAKWWLLGSAAILALVGWRFYLWSKKQKASK